MPYNPVGNMDFGGLLEAVSALQRNPQLLRASGYGAQSITGSVLYGVVTATGSVLLSDGTAAYQVGAPGLVFPYGAPLMYPPTGGAITVSPSNSSALWAVIYK